MVMVILFFCFFCFNLCFYLFYNSNNNNNLLFLKKKNQNKIADSDAIAYCERFLEFLIDLEAQLPTRRYFNTLLHDHQILVLCKLSPLLKRKEGGELFKQLLEILK